MKRTILSRRNNTLLIAGFSLRTLTVIAALLVALPVAAQRRHQFSVHAGGGLSTLDYTTPAGTTQLGFGGALGVDYAWFFNNNWGVTTGLEAALFNGKYDLPALNDAYPSHDGEESFTFNYALTRYRETQQAILLNIPLMLRFERGWFYAAVGAKAGIRLGAAYKNKTDELAASGYYAQQNLTLHDPAFMGFGTFNNLHNEGDVALKTTLFASAEAGIKWGRLYTGLYLDYGLNDVNRATRTPGLVPYELPEPAAYKPRSVLATTAGDHHMAGKLRLLAAGLKIAFVIGRSKAAVGSGSMQSPAGVGASSGRPQPGDTEKMASGSSSVEAEVQRQAKEVRQAEAQRQAEEARTVAEAKREAEATQQAAEAQRQYDLDMQRLGTPVDGYPIDIANPTPSIQSKLDAVAEILLRYPDLHVQIAGHTCNLGADAVNLQVGQRRADAAKAYLVEKGVAAHRITTVSKGETEPVVLNTSEKNRRKNRRILIVVSD